MKKITALLLALMMLAGVFASCGKPKDTGKAGKLKVVTTIFPEYDWVRAILGDKAENAEVTMLLDNGVDLHSYQPTQMILSRSPTATCSSMWAASPIAGWKTL